MIALEVGGLVEVRSGSGVYVLPQPRQGELQLPEDAPGPFELLEARMLVEGETAALAAERISNEELQQLRHCIRQMTQLVERGEVEKAEQVDQQFHCLIASASRNSALLSTVSWLWHQRNQSEISTLFHRHAREHGSTPRSNEHQAILAALERRDAEAARTAMRSHLQRVITAFSDYSLT